MSDHLKGRRVLILNSDMRPLNAVKWQRGTAIMLQQRAIVLELARGREGEPLLIRSSSGRCIELPSVILKPEYVKMDDGIRYSRYNCFNRDDYTCQYCGDDECEVTIDHVRPKQDIRETGDDEGPLWRNRVTCCKRCNGQKGNRSLEEMAGQRTWNGKSFRLINEPESPEKSGASRFLRLVNRSNLEWLDYIPDWKRLATKVDKRAWLIGAYEERSRGEVVFGEADERSESGDVDGGGETPEPRRKLGRAAGGKKVKDKRRDVAAGGRGRDSRGGRRGRS